MGCSSSLSQQSTPEKQPLECSNVFNNKNDLSMMVHNTNKPTSTPVSETDSPSSQTLPFNPTHIVIISRDSTIADSADSSNIVPIMPPGEHSDDASSQSHLSVGGSKHLRSQSLPGSIKSVLKTGRNNTHDHIVTQRPIKNVTFMESVTVLTVY